METKQIKRLLILLCCIIALGVILSSIFTAIQIDINKWTKLEYAYIKDNEYVSRVVGAYEYKYLGNNRIAIRTNDGRVITTDQENVIIYEKEEK